MIGAMLTARIALVRQMQAQTGDIQYPNQLGTRTLGPTYLRYPSLKRSSCVPLRHWRREAAAASPLDWHSLPQRFPQNLLHPVIPSAPWRSPYDCSLPSLIGFDDEELNPSLQKGPLLRWPGGAEYHR
jgi:hypothetical protein